MKTTSYSLLLIFFLLFSCKEKEKIHGEDNFTIYTIKRGGHSSNSKPALYSGDELRFLAKFDETAIYSTSNSSNQADINKLYGFSDCGSLHQQNSARFGWRWYDNELEIFAYCYSNGVRAFKFLTSVDLNKEYEYKIYVTPDEYFFSINGVIKAMPRSCSDEGSNYRLYPYFGGDEVAPHEIMIRIKEL